MFELFSLINFLFYLKRLFTKTLLDSLLKRSNDKVRCECGDGNAFQRQGYFQTAVEYHKRVLEIAKEVGDKTKDGSVYGNLGIAHHRLGDLKTAIYYYQRCLNLAKEVGDKLREGKAYGNLGTAHQSLCNFKTATDYHERHLKIAKEVSDKGNEGHAYYSLGNVYQGRGDFKTAIYYYRRALEMFKEVGHKDQEGATYGNLGSACRRLGDFKTAIDYHRAHLQIAKEVRDISGERTAWVNLGNVYQSLGYLKTAMEYYNRGLEITKEMGDKAREGSINGNIGAAHQRLGDFQNAIDYHQRALRIAKEVGNKVGEGGAYGNLGNAHHSLGNFKTAIDYYQRALKMAKEVGDKFQEGQVYGSLGNAYQGLGDLKAATDCHEAHLDIAEEMEDKVGTAGAFYSLGVCSALLGFFPKAIECLYSSVKTLNIIRHDLKGKDEWKIRYRNMHEFAYSSLWRLLLKQGKVAEALFAAEQGRAQALHDLMELNYGFETTYSQLHTQEESTYDSCRSPQSTAVFMAIDEREIVFWVVHDGNDVELRRKEFSNNSSVNLKGFLESLIVTASLEISGRAGIQCEDRSLDTLEDEQLRVNRRSPQTPAKPVSLGMNALRMFYDIIIEPIADLVHGDELILVPEGPLCLAPFAAFMDSHSMYLCDVCRIRVLPSFASLKMITESPDGYHSKTGVLLVGDPWVQEIVIPGKKLEQLPCARKEVQMIGGICKTDPLIGREATKSEVLRRLPSVALIHIAAHGRMETGEIALAPNITRASQIPGNEDFLLTMEDVLNVRIRARLVVLSCCHSGRGEIKAEGVVGIARAFLGAGARAVLVSLWAIDDAASLEFMQSFYSHLKKGISASESLNKAMKHMRESNEFNKVKYWAPFVLVGDDVTLEFGGNE